MKKLGFLILLTTLTGCVSFFDGSFQSPSFATKDNFSIVKTIEGKAQATYVFGIGGNLKDGLVNEAKRNMYLSHQLKPNQNLTNITVDTKVTSFILPIFYQSKVVLVSADVIEFYDVQSGEAPNKLVSQTEKEIIQSATRDQKVESATEWKVVQPVTVVTAKSEEFDRISSFKSKRPATLRIVAPSDIKVGDYVSFKSNNESGSNTSYGIVQSINGDSYKVKVYKSVDEFDIIEDIFINFRKVVY